MLDEEGKGLDNAIVEGRYIREFLDELTYRRRLSQSTVRAYSSDLKAFSDYLSAERKKGLLRASRDEIAEYMVFCENIWTLAILFF